MVTSLGFIPMETQDKERLESIRVHISRYDRLIERYSDLINYLADYYIKQEGLEDVTKEGKQTISTITSTNTPAETEQPDTRNNGIGTKQTSEAELQPDSE